MPHDSLPQKPAFPTGHETQTRRSLPTVLPRFPIIESGRPSYYDIPLLKKPVWTWEIGAYFYLGGLSAGSYLLARTAERVGGSRYRALTRAGIAVAVAAILPCPPLLIADLGDPKRFHHMLRVFKPRSPMNLGSWALTGYSGILFLTAIDELRRGLPSPSNGGTLATVGRTALDLAGIPLAFFFSGYTGVLLSGTSTPVWTKNPWLGPLFTASAIGNGASAISLALTTRENRESTLRPAIKALEGIDKVAHIAEGVALAGYFARAGSLAKPLTQGKLAPYFWGAVGGLVVSEVARQLPIRSKGRWVKAAAALASLAGGFCLKWAMQQAGSSSANDPDANRQSSRSRHSVR